MSISYQDPARYFMEQQSRKDEQFRSLLNMFMMMKQQKASQAQELWDRQYKQEGRDLEKKNIESLIETRGAERAQPEWVFRLNEVMSNPKYTPEQKEYFKATGRFQPIEKGLTPGQIETRSYRKKSDFEKSLERGSSRFQSRISKLESPLTQTELIAGAMSGTFPDIETDKAAISNLTMARDELERIAAQSELGQLTDEDKRLAARIMGSMNRVERKGAFWKDEIVPIQEEDSTTDKISGYISDKEAINLGLEKIITDKNVVVVRHEGKWKRVLKKK